MEEKKIPDIGDIAIKFHEFKIEKTQDADENFCEQSLKEIVVRNHQKFCAKYIADPESPAGLLVFHSLGSGKSITFVLAANELDRDNIIILPASLKGNAQMFIDKFYTGTKTFSFLSYDAPNLLAQYKKLGKRSFEEKKDANYFDDKFVIIDEAHVFFQHVISGKAKQASDLFEILLSAKNTKFMFMTGTPISGDPFELAPMFNLIRKGTLPNMRDLFYKYFSTSDGYVANGRVFADRIAGMVSYYKGVKDTKQRILPKMEKKEIIKLPMGPVQWQNYIVVRMQELDFERKSKYSKKVFSAGAYKRPERANYGAYKAGSLQACDFAFPSDVEEKFSQIKSKHEKKIAEIKWSLMLKTHTFPEIYENIHKYSTKIEHLLKHIQGLGRRKIFIYTRFKVVGTYILSEMLKQIGYSEFTGKKNYLSDNPNSSYASGKYFAVINGDTGDDKYNIIKAYNDKNNAYGDKIQIIIGTNVIAAGVSLFDTREVHVFEPQWKVSTMDQIIGRVNRVCSHMNLPLSERSFDVYFYISEIPPEYKSSVDFDDSKSSDEIIYELSERRNSLIDQFLKILKKNAVDCELNFLDNDVDCRKCLNKKKLFIPDIKQHLLLGSQCEDEYAELFDYEHKGTMYKRDEEGKIYKPVPGENGETVYEEISLVDVEENII